MNASSKMKELEKRKVIQSFFNYGQTASQIWRHVMYVDISRATVYRVVKQLQNGGNSSRKTSSGVKFLETTRIAKRKLTDRLQRNPAQSVRKIAREIGIPKSTAQDIVRRDLKLRARKKERKQALVSPQKVKRATRSRALRRSLEGDLHRRVLFSDENFFKMDSPLIGRTIEFTSRKGLRSLLMRKQ